MGSHVLKQEEFTIVQFQIEAMLNSWTLVVASVNREDLLVITPCHYFVGEELQGNSEPFLTVYSWRIEVDFADIMVILEILLQRLSDSDASKN